MMTVEELKEKYTKMSTLKEEIDRCASLKECISCLSDEGLMELYNFYDITEDQSLKKTKAAKINYLVKEIPSQFLDDFRFMMNEKDREIIINLCQNKQIESFDALIHLMEFGYVFLTPSGTVVFPQELQWFITDLFM